VLAVPVAPTDTLEQLRSEADHVECLESHLLLGAIGNFYGDFRQVSDEEMIAALSEAAAPI
jgi:predicted phosphoribosyltransferase